MSEGVMRNSCSKGSSGVVEKQRKRLNQRQKARILLVFSVAFLAVIAILGVVLHDAAMVTDFSRKNICSLSEISFWYGLAGQKYVLPYSYRFIHEYSYWRAGSRCKRSYGTDSWNLCSNSWEKGGLCHLFCN
mgnify:CR=1 FL=1